MNDNVVLILGAGASVDYGYPTGRELTDMIGDYRNFSVFRNQIRAITNEYEKGFELITNNFFQSRTTSIDSWLAKKENQECESTGKLLLAYFIAQREMPQFIRTSFFHCQYPERGVPKNDWYQLLFNTIAPENFDEFPKRNKNLSIITFNYDRSLEFYLLNVMQSMYIGRNVHDCWEKLKSIPIIHVYGLVGNLPIMDPNDSIPYGEISNVENFIKRSKQLRIIPEMRKNKDDILNQIQEKVKAANNIYFMGFSYNSDNLNILGFPLKYRKKKFPYITGTIFGMEEGEIQIAQHQIEMIKLDELTSQRLISFRSYNCDVHAFFRKEVIKAFND